MVWRAIIAVMLLCVSSSVYADIYRYETEEGVIVFTDTPNQKQAVTVSKQRAGKVAVRPVAYTSQGGQDRHKYYSIVKHKAEEYSLDPELIRAIITVESAWSPDAVSRKGAVGLMQLMPFTARHLAVKDPFDPEENIAGGVKYFRMLLDAFNGSLRHALAAYNIGPDRARQAVHYPRGTETRDYIERVLALYGGEKRFQYVPLKKKRTANETIYKIVFADGTTLFTNTPLPTYGSYQ